MAMKAALSGSFSPEFAHNLASGEFSGENRIRKARGLIGKLTVRNPIFPFIQLQKENFLEVAFDKAYFERIDAVYKDRYELRVFPNEELRDATEEEVKLLNTKCNEN